MKLILALTLPLLQGALGWGDVGHRTVAYLAYKYLQPSTQEYIDGILAYGDGEDVSDGAVWPDQIKRQRPATAPWHFIGSVALSRPTKTNLSSKMPATHLPKRAE
jgi:hypothetical protein